jgi:2-polyprenyl-6-methoxyphenol hydroxylase-like FAD-dependent oxidoreductase
MPIEPLDVAIAGCGVAGLSAALLLARNGHRVTLFDRFAAPGPIGSGLMLQPTGMAILADLGVRQDIMACGARIERLHGEAGGRIVLDVCYAALPDPTACAIGIHRASLFDILHRAAQRARIPIHTAREVIAVTDQRLAFAGGGDAGPFDLIVDALGTKTPLAAPCGRELSYGALWANVRSPGGEFDQAALVQRYRGASVMAGVMPIGRSFPSGDQQSAFFWSLRAEDHARWLLNGLAAWKAEVLALWPATKPILDQFERPDQLTFARYAHRTVRRPAQGRLIQIGDAWHSASPQLGQGANMALLDAYALAAGLRAGRDVEDGLRRAIAMRQGHVRLYQALTALLTPVYQSNSRVIPWVRDRIMAPISTLWPFPRLQAALVSGLIGDPLKALGIRLAAPETDR